MAVTVFSPAKINLYLAITGRRDDGFHELVSVVAPLDFGDELTATPAERVGGSRFRLECDQPGIPLNESNLILKAAQEFAEAAGWAARSGSTDDRAVDFRLTKRIPIGAGLGGGSSNAVAALRALNMLSGNPLSDKKLALIAAKLGSDCALFLEGAPVIMRGRGERIERLPEGAAERLKGQRVLLFKPSFGISTPWAYGRMAMEAPRHYLPGSSAERKLAEWLNATTDVSDLLFNNMEGVAFEKFIALPVMLQKLRVELGVTARMSGSGSTCFALTGGSAISSNAGSKDSGTGSDSMRVTQMKQLIRRSWGETVFVQEAVLA